MKAYRIVDWWKFELLKNGKLATAKTKMESLRKSPLIYVRFPVHGHALSADYRRMVKKAGELAAACDGLYKMLVGLAGNQVREYRGWILDDRQRPLNPGQVAELLCLSEEKTYEIFEILTDSVVKWVNLEEFPEALQSQITKSGNESKTHGSQNTKSGNGFEKTENDVNSDDFSDLSESHRKSLSSNDLSDGSQNTKSGKNWEKKGSPLNETETVTEDETVIEEIEINNSLRNRNETETEVRVCARERKNGQGENAGQPQAQPAAQPSVSGSGTDSVPASDSEKLADSVSDPVSDSDSISQAGPRAGPGADGSEPLTDKERLFELSRECKKATLEFSQIICPRNNSDTTTINDIYMQLQQRLIAGSPYPLFELSLNTARQCWRADKPIAMFVAAMKKPPFYYVPKKLSVVPGKFSQVGDIH